MAKYWQRENTSLKKHLSISVVVLSAGIALSFFDLTTIWVYFGWTNQLLATITLWMATFYLYREHKFYWLILLSAGFMTSVYTTYIMYDKIGFNLPLDLSVIAGASVAVLLVTTFAIVHRKNNA